MPLCVPHRVVPPLPPGPAVRLEGAATAPGGGAWFVGDTDRAPAIFRWDGKRLRVTPLPRLGADASLAAVTAPARDDAWAVGAGLVLHWNGRAWTRSYFPNGPWEAVSADAPDDVWLVGKVYDGAFFVDRWDGERWSKVPFAPVSARSGTRVVLHEVDLTSVLALAPDDVWVTGVPADELDFVAHWDGSGWTLWRDDPWADLDSLAMLPGEDLWASGWSGTTEFRNGSWHVRTPNPGNVHSIVARRDELWGSRGGTLLRWSGQRWQTLDGPHPQATIVALAASPDGSVWAATDAGPVHYVCRR